VNLELLFRNFPERLHGQYEDANLDALGYPHPFRPEHSRRIGQQPVLEYFVDPRLGDNLLDSPRLLFVFRGEFPCVAVPVTLKLYTSGA
jgi:hypothetical protein